jgi:hypothetical protein
MPHFTPGQSESIPVPWLSFAASAGLLGLGAFPQWFLFTASDSSTGQIIGHGRLGLKNPARKPIRGREARGVVRK